MSGVTIRHGIDGIQGYADLGLTDVVIDSLTGSGVVVRGGDLSASGLEVAHVAYGITNYSTILSSTITCTDSWFHDLDEGIFLSNEVGALEVRRSTFEDCLDGLKLGYQADATVDSCTIPNNDIGLWAFLTSGLLITNADFDSNATTGLYLMLDAHATVKNYLQG